MKRITLALSIVLLQANVALAGTPANPSGMDRVLNVAVGISSVVVTAVYSPVKLVFSILSLPFAHCASQGDYVVTTDHLKGRTPLRFTQCGK